MLQVIRKARPACVSVMGTLLLATACTASGKPATGNTPVSERVRDCQILGSRGPQEGAASGKGSSAYFVKVISPPKVIQKPTPPTPPTPPTKAVIGSAPGPSREVPVPQSRRDDGMAISLGKLDGKCHFLTASHGVLGAQQITVSPWSHVERPPVETAATVVWVDQGLDVALLSTPANDDCAAPTSFEPSPQVGEDLYLFGQPDPYRGAVSKGVFSGFWMMPQRGPTIVSDALIFPGYSGGGAYTAAGKVVGMIVEQSKHQRPYSFIVPICSIAERLPKLGDGRGDSDGRRRTEPPAGRMETSSDR